MACQYCSFVDSFVVLCFSQIVANVCLYTDSRPKSNSNDHHVAPCLFICYILCATICLGEHLFQSKAQTGLWSLFLLNSRKHFFVKCAAAAAQAAGRSGLSGVVDVNIELPQKSMLLMLICQGGLLLQLQRQQDGVDHKTAH